LGYPTVKTQVSGTVMYRMQQAQAMINTTTAGSVFASIDSFRGVLNTVNSGLSSISTLTDPTYGMLAGLNCQLFGQDFVTFQNVICGSFYNNMYTIRLTFGIASWGILFSLCCIVCSGVRHFKNMNRRAMVAVSD
jgi:small basic protein